MILQFFFGDVILTVYLTVYNFLYFFHQLIISWLLQRYLLLKPRSDLFSHFVFCCLCPAYIYFSMKRKWNRESERARTGLCRWNPSINICIGRGDKVQHRDLENTATDRFCQRGIKQKRGEGWDMWQTSESVSRKVVVYQWFHVCVWECFCPGMSLKGPGISPGMSPVGPVW